MNFKTKILFVLLISVIAFILSAISLLSAEIFRIIAFAYMCYIIWYTYRVSVNKIPKSKIEEKINEKLKQLIPYHFSLSDFIFLIFSTFFITVIAIFVIYFLFDSGLK